MATFRSPASGWILAVADDRLRPQASARPGAATLLVFCESSHGPGVIGSGVEGQRGLPASASRRLRSSATSVAEPNPDASCVG